MPILSYDRLWLSAVILRAAYVDKVYEITRILLICCIQRNKCNTWIIHQEIYSIFVLSYFLHFAISMAFPHSIDTLIKFCSHGIYTL
jgi:hypothetical protein